MNESLSKEEKKNIMKDVILKLHNGLSITEAKDRFEREIGSISSTEIAELEQSLITEGLSTDEIKKFCNVHALLFGSALEKAPLEETSPAHPVYLFKLENTEIEKAVASIRDAVQTAERSPFGPFKDKLRDRLLYLRGLETHYERKEQVLFPYLEQKGLMGPSKVMWGKDNEIRDLMKSALADLEKLGGPADVEAYAEATLNPFLEEVEGMVFKEENILFPTSLEKLDPGDWVNMLRQSDEIGYVVIQKPEETDLLIRHLESALQEEAVFERGGVSFPSGTLSLGELMPLLNTLPLDLTFVDKEDTVKYFTEGAERIFHRPRSVIGRKVQNCHPPQSLDVVEGILASFKDGSKDFYEFWIDYQGRLVHIRYFAVRDAKGQYLGTLEVTQDVTGIKKLEGEKRLVSEGD
jgi:PAS domain S-box-containing protein